MRPEVADIFRRHGESFRADQGGRLLPDQRRVMAAIAACRTATLGGHVERCDDCGMMRVLPRQMSRLYRRLFLQRLQAAFDKEELVFVGNLAPLAEPTVFAQHLGALRNVEWNVYASGPSA
jgi:hypothetical protein